MDTGRLSMKPKVNLRKGLDKCRGGKILPGIYAISKFRSGGNYG